MEEKFIETPDIVTSVDVEQAKLMIEISLVDVEKENINLMMDENGCYLSVPAETVEYATAMSFMRAVKPSEAKATYEDGYLKIEIPFKEPLVNYSKVQIA